MIRNVVMNDELGCTMVALWCLDIYWWTEICVIPILDVFFINIK